MGFAGPISDLKMNSFYMNMEQTQNESTLCIMPAVRNMHSALETPVFVLLDVGTHLAHALVAAMQMVCKKGSQEYE